MTEIQRWTLPKNEADSALFKQAAEKALAYRNVSNWHGLYELAFFWGLIVGAYALLLAADFHWAACLVAFAVVAKAHNGLLLCGHEAVHKLLFGNARLNEFAGQYLSFAPMGVGFHRARLSHIDHHHYLLTARDEKLDQQLEYPGFRSFVKHVTAPLFGSYVLKFVGRFLGVRVKRRARPEFTYPPELARADLRAIILTQLVLLPVLTLIDWRLYLLFWALPLVTLTAVLHNAKGFLDHLRWPEEAEGMLYSYRPHWLDRLLFGIQQMNHAEHHLFPHVPHYRLRHLSQWVDQLSMVRRRQGYFQTLLRFGHDIKTGKRV